MLKVNLLLWIASLTLQTVLLAALIARRITRQLPAFPVLIAFYILRSLGLYVTAAHLHGPDYTLLTTALAVLDVLLQTILAFELFAATRPLTLRGYATFSLILLAAASLAFLASTLVPANPRAPIDRGVLFTSALFLLTFLASLSRPTRPLVRRVLQGFALFAVASTLGQIGRTLAAAHRDPILFHRWSYAEPTTYLAVVLLWILTLPREAPSPTLGALAPAL